MEPGNQERCPGTTTTWLRGRRGPALALAIGVAAAWSTIAFGSDLSIPNAFVNGSVADADEVNANFAAVESAVDDNAARVSNLEVQLPVVDPDKGAGNTAAGGAALAGTTTGVDNTAIGMDALGNTTTGSGNTAIGDGAGQAQTTGVNSIYIDNTGVAAESDTIRIGDTQTRAFMEGIRGVTTALTDTRAVLIDPAGQLGTQGTLPETQVDPAIARNLRNRLVVSAAGGDFATIGDALGAIGTTLPAATAALRRSRRLRAQRHRDPVRRRPGTARRGHGRRSRRL